MRPHVVLNHELLTNRRHARARFAHNPSQAEADRRALERATATRNALKPASDALCRIWELVSSQLRACEHDIEVYRNRRCFFSLPDEILSTVLEYAALRLIVGDRKKGTISTVKAAAKLSHVCKHFRHLITHSPTLWKSVFGGMSNNMMSRCRTDNAEISLSTSFYKIGYKVFSSIHIFHSGGDGNVSKVVLLYSQRSFP